MGIVINGTVGTGSNLLYGCRRLNVVSVVWSSAALSIISIDKRNIYCIEIRVSMKTRVHKQSNKITGAVLYYQRIYFLLVTYLFIPFVFSLFNTKSHKEHFSLAQLHVQCTLITLKRKSACDFCFYCILLF